MKFSSQSVLLFLSAALLSTAFSNSAFALQSNQGVIACETSPEDQPEIIEGGCESGGGGSGSAGGG